MACLGLRDLPNVYLSVLKPGQSKMSVTEEPVHAVG
jgi:hypothetical protein